MPTVPTAAPTRSRMAGRTRSLTAVTVVAIVAAFVGYLAARQVQSPAEMAARSDPPPASLITARVEHRVVSDTLTTRGSVGSVSTVNAVPDQAPAGVAVALITGVPARAGARLEPGDVVVEISGRPVFFLPGKIPAYRDLAPGDEGPDVTQLQTGLRVAGLTVDDPKGRFGPSTGTAVREMFTRAGHRPTRAGGLPRSAITFVPADTSTVVVAKATLGQPAADADLQIASGELVVLVDTTASSSALIQEGASVDLTAELLDDTAVGTVTSVSRTPEGGRAVVTPDKPLPSTWAGEDVRVGIAGTGSVGKVLAVPVAAVFLDGAGKASVRVLRAGRQEAVVVTSGATGEGYVQVTAEADATLQEGDDVVIGTGGGG